MKLRLLSLAMVAALAAPAAQAIDLGHGLSVKGFGTVGLVHSDSDEADYVSNYYFQPKGAGRSDETSFNVDTKAGVQLDWAATDRLSLTGQLISKKYEDNTWTPQLEWAYAKFKATPDLDIRAGRIRPAIYMLSDFLDVNYANPWVRPPVEFYSVAPITRMEGADLLWRPTTGDISWLVQPYVGKTKLDIRGAEIEGEKIMGLNVTGSTGDFTFRAGYIQTDLTVTDTSSATAIGILDAYCAGGLGDPAACALSSDLNPDAKKSSFASLGGSWDNGDYFVSGEWGKRESDSFVADATSWYITAGARFGKWTPYATYSAVKVDSATMYTGLTSDFTINVVATNLLRGDIFDQQSVTLGVRYDVAKNVALKAQWDHVMTECTDDPDPFTGFAPGTCGGLFMNRTGSFSADDNTVDLISVSVDFVF